MYFISGPGWTVYRADARDNKFSGVDAAVAGKRDRGRHLTIRTAHGYRPTCGCPPGEPIGCIVADPFLGSGTTLQVAVATGRRFAGGEVAAEYFPLIRERATTPWQPPKIEAQ